ncbi:hypothetical protein ALC57_02373, partial [Trachymyrmex cornetzi]
NVCLWAEEKYIEKSKTSFANFNHVFNIAKDLCGPLYEVVFERNLTHIYLLTHNAYISHRLLLLRLYIKSKWLEMVQPALEFARKYCTPTFACSTFRELYELEETRHLAISGFTVIVEKKCKMLPQAIEAVVSILKINLKDIYVLTSKESACKNGIMMLEIKKKSK